MSKLQKTLLDPAMHVVAWVVGYYAAKILLAGTNSVEGYAVLSAWWLALYVGYVLSVGLAAFVPLALGYFAAGIATSWIGTGWLIVEPARELGGWILVIACGQALVFASPVVLNWLVRSLVVRS